MQYINLNKILDLGNEINDLLLISIDDKLNSTYDKDGVKIAGEILISGKVRIDDDEKEFSDSVDVDIFLTDEEIENRNEIKVNISDFTYNIEKDKLNLNISLKLEGLKEIETTFLADENNEFIEQEKIEETIELEEENDIYVDIDINVNEDRIEENEKEEIEKKSLLKSVFTSKKINEEVSWKLHCIKEEKTYEEIASKYNVKVEKLVALNKNEKLEEGRLVFIPLD